MITRRRRLTIAALILLVLGGGLWWSTRPKIDPRLVSEIMNDDWPFDQPRNCTTVTMRQVLDGSEPILLVAHDEEDEGWQFIGTTDASFADGRVVCLEHIVQLDPTVMEVADLPPGWQATREHPGGPWVRFKSPAEGEEG